MLRRPDEIKLIIVDPKMVDMAAYRGIPHLLTPVVTDIQKAEAVLNWAVNEMERRYKLYSLTGARNLTAYNKMKKEEILKIMADAGNPAIFHDGEIPYPMPYIVVVVDELADLMFASPKEIEFSITRIAQKARAAGIHLILSTQRPSVDVITGLIKANVPTRIAFKVAAKVDSRTILDMNGAETLLGHGDMLYVPPGTAKAVRGQGVYISDAEINDIVEFCKVQGQPVFSTSLEKAQAGGGDAEGGEIGDIEDGLEDAIRVTCETQRGSASLLQRKLGFGYNRATKMVETMEMLGVVGPYEGSKARQVLMSIEEFESIGGLKGILERHEKQKGG
jgi:S-DNA-T family DNA segregation ATPase FtsK/SpoIIIE